jgi:ectoine hydroxylase-related dioxygenase (phytanoyl-CoA dioxygenase family)
MIPVSATPSYAAQVASAGFAVVPEALSAVQAGELRDLLTPAVSSEAPVSAGTRNLLQIRQVAELAVSDAILNLIEPILGPEPRPLRAIWFDKQHGANWKVPFHQDLTMPLQERREVEGFTAWSVKEGVPHVRPPISVLERMLAVRLHLDDCGPDNGPLRVLPGTHTLGRLKPPQVAQLVAQTPEESLLVAVGDAILMRPLLLHASSPAASPNHRRVIHIEYLSGPLPGGLRPPDWRAQIER